MELRLLGEPEYVEGAGAADYEVPPLGPAGGDEGGQVKLRVGIPPHEPVRAAVASQGPLGEITSVVSVHHPLPLHPFERVDAQ